MKPAPLYDRELKKALNDLLLSVRNSVLLVTAVIKLFRMRGYEGKPVYFPDLLRAMMDNGVKVWILAASRGSQPYRSAMIAHPILTCGGRYSICYASHSKLGIFDNRTVAFGSMNLTAGGYSVYKKPGNHEFGVIDKDPSVIQSFSRQIDRIWSRVRCKTCRASTIRSCFLENQAFANDVGIKLETLCPDHPWLHPGQYEQVAKYLSKNKGKNNGR